ncbi:hypothetical protein NPIL_97621 [Nephila pilipes]|uniref:Uncharacterized protein n=1 Tax=Nephila pilipes TaxID=299642 RepID=A0A8X6U4M9_NEPPI|nr:hypothetical protein NPIL_97621 [Nephila pilipes]
MFILLGRHCLSEVTNMTDDIIQIKTLKPSHSTNLGISPKLQLLSEDFVAGIHKHGFLSVDARCFELLTLCQRAFQILSRKVSLFLTWYVMGSGRSRH